MRENPERITLSPSSAACFLFTFILSFYSGNPAGGEGNGGGNPALVQTRGRSRFFITHLVLSCTAVTNPKWDVCTEQWWVGGFILSLSKLPCAI